MILNGGHLGQRGMSMPDFDKGEAVGMMLREMKYHSHVFILVLRMYQIIVDASFLL